METLIKTFVTKFGQTVRVYVTYAEVDIIWKALIKTVRVPKDKVVHVKQFQWCYTQRTIKGKVKHCLEYINPENPKNSKPSLIKALFGYDTNAFESERNYFDVTIYER